MLVFVFKECLVRADHFGIVAEARTEAGAKLEEMLHFVRGQEGIA